VKTVDAIRSRTGYLMNELEKPLDYGGSAIEDN
jgi:hypothetical protein